jgi:tetratricopeptide (TPR) repeat protein
MLTAQKPFAGRDRWEAPVSTRELAPEIPPNWDRTIRSCLQTSAAARPASMAAVVAGFGMPATGGRLDQLAPGSTAALDPGNSAAEKTGRGFAPQRRHILWLSLTAAAALAGLGLDRRRGREPSFHTSSVEAEEAYERALEDMRLGRYQAAADQLREAVRRDPAFALAHIVLAKVQITIGQYSKGHASARQAYDLTIRNPEAYTIWDHYRVLGLVKHLRREYGGARDDFRALVGFALERAARSWFDRQPYYAVAVEGFRERALAYSFEGFPLEAQAEIQKAQAYDPGNAGLDVLESLFLVEQGNGKEALQKVQGAWQKSARGGNRPPNVYPAWGEGMARLLLEDPGRAPAAFRRLGEARGDPLFSAWGALLEAQADVYAGNWPDAMAKLRETDTPDSADRISEVAIKRQLWIAELAALMGADWRDPLRRLEELAGAEPAPQNVVVFRDAALLAGGEGDLAVVQRFRALIGAVEQAFPQLGSSSDRPEPIPFVRHHAEHLRGEEARLRGDAGAARAIFSDLAHLFLRDPRSWLSLARVKASAGLLDEAIASYQRVLALRGRIFTQDCCTLLLRCYLELARCLRHASRPDEARRYYDAFLKSAGDSKLAATTLAEKNSLAP